MLKKLKDSLAYIWHKVVYIFIGYRDIQLVDTNNCKSTTTVAVGMVAGLMLTALAWPLIKFLATSVALLVMMVTFYLIVLFVVITTFYFCIKAAGTIIG